CSDNQSRNRRFGLAIGQGVSIQDAQASVGGEVEGLPNTRQLLALGEALSVELPITQQVYRILYQGVSPKEGLDSLLSRQRANME
ncbi:MAG TPA: glycerol-3-phosphate dehydrogenase, partial [Coxiellaceae bacterium]|nr:glycerol-3-phosphate dehydrogenase [Coxiellaceae bacterium]